jgi:hypothetical protein
MGPYVFSFLFFSLGYSLHYCGASGSIQLPNNQLPSLTLKKVVVLARHGARITAVASNLLPTKSGRVVWSCDLQDVVSDNLMPNFPAMKKKYKENRNSVPGNCSLGQLTRFGARQHNELGMALKRAYPSFLPSDPSAVYVRSTDTERTMLSARHIMGATFNFALPVQVETMDPFLDNAFPNPTLCPALGREMAAVQNRFISVCPFGCSFFFFFFFFLHF